MTLVRTSLSIAVLAATTLALSAGAAPGDRQDTQYFAQAAAIQVAQATPGGPGMGMGTRSGMPAPAYGEQMKAMQAMHEKMLAAKTPEERNALMASQMALMQKGMNMMGGAGGMGAMGGSGHMGGATATGQPAKPSDMAARQGMMEQHMEMMQSMMQMMMDRMPPVPATK